MHMKRLRAVFTMLHVVDRHFMCELRVLHMVDDHYILVF